MGVNNAENEIVYALTNKVNQLERDFNEYRTTAQRIGNGSLNYATFTGGFAFGPVTIAAGVKVDFAVLFMDVGVPFTYDGRPAINRRTFLDLFITPYVDTLDAVHAYPNGASLTAGQKKLQISGPWNDYLGSGLDEDNGQRLVLFSLTNTDSSSHNYYVEGNALIPRPALKPQ